MASVVAPLVNGFPGAPSGTAEFYVHGTGTPATVYSDPNGATPETTHGLDQYGALVRYVEEVVDVVVKNASGGTVSQFTWIDDARVTRVENGFFNGASGGGTAPGGRTTVDAVFGVIGASFGWIDATILPTGSATPFTLDDGLAGVIRDNRVAATVQLTGTSYAPDADYAVHTVIHDSGASMAFGDPTNGSGVEGSPLIILYRNATGGSRTPTWGSGYAGVPATAVANGDTALYVFRYSFAAALGVYIAVTTNPVVNA